MKIEIENKNLIGQQNTFITTDDETMGIYSWYGFDYNELLINETTFVIVTLEQLEVLKEIIDHTLTEHKKLYSLEREEK
jgi:hypothetical protein